MISPNEIGGDMQVDELPLKVLWRCTAILLTVWLVGCNFDREYQYNLRFPATVILKNETKGTVVVDAIRSSTEAKRTFALKSRSMEPGETLRIRVSEGVYNDIVAGAFVASGSCGGQKPWEVSGRKLPRDGIRNTQQWNVTVTIRTCDP